MSVQRSMHLGVLTTALLLLLALVAPVAEAAQAGGSGVVTANGRIGKLYANGSRVADVTRFAGKPSRRFSGKGAGDQAFTALEYRCGSGKRTTYYLDGRGRLANFTTNCRGWRTAEGTRVGMEQEEAVEREGKEVGFACGGGDSIQKRGRRGSFLFITFFKSGGFVRALAVAGRNSVLGC